MMSTTKKDISNALMRGADSLRDTIDAANYKDYVLPIMFVKYLSDCYNEEVEKLEKEYSGARLERQKQYLPFKVAESCNFKTLFDQRYAENIGELINMAMRQIEADNNQQLAGVLNTVDYNSENALKAIDSNLTTFWEAPQIGTEITFDLAAKSKFNHIGFAFQNGNTTKSYFRILFSDDGADWTHFADLKSRGVSSDVEVYDIGEHKARYIKIIAFGTESGANFRLSEVRFLKEDGLIIFNKSNK